MYYRVSGRWVDAHGNPVSEKEAERLEEELTSGSPIDVGGNADLEAQINRLKAELKEAKETAATNAEWVDTFHQQKANHEMLLGMVEQTIDGKLAHDGEPPELIAKLKGRLEALQKLPLLPADALERLTAVKGIGEKLAPVALEALTK